MRVRTIRVPEDLWEDAHNAATQNGEYLSEVIRRALERYVKAQHRHESDR